MTNFVREVSTF